MSRRAIAATLIISVLGMLGPLTPAEAGRPAVAPRHLAAVALKPYLPPLHSHAAVLPAMAAKPAANDSSKVVVLDLGRRSHTETAPVAPQPRKPGLLGRWMNRLHELVLRNQTRLGIKAITEERPFFQKGTSVFGFELGLTLSNLQTSSLVPGRELIHVVDPSGGSNLELVLWQKKLGGGTKQHAPGQGTWIELQGPAIDTSVEPGELPIGGRFLGVGIVGAKMDAVTKRSVGYTVEVKATEKTAAYFLPMILPGLAAQVGTVTSGGWGHVVGQVFSGAVPIVSGALAVASTRRAVAVVRDAQSSKFDKTAACAHAGFDWLRVAFPIAGTLGNVAVAATVAAHTFLQAKQVAKQAVREPA